MVASFSPRNGAVAACEQALMLDPDNRAALERYYGGQEDPATLERWARVWERKSMDLWQDHRSSDEEA